MCLSQQPVVNSNLILFSKMRKYVSHAIVHGVDMLATDARTFIRL